MRWLRHIAASSLLKDGGEEPCTMSPAKKKNSHISRSKKKKQNPNHRNEKKRSRRTTAIGRGKGSLEKPEETSPDTEGRGKYTHMEGGLARV